MAAAPTTNNSNGNGGGIGGLSWGNAREIVMIFLIMIGGWWGLVYSPIQEKFQNFKESDILMSRKMEDFAGEVRGKFENFLTKKEFEKEKKDVDNQFAAVDRRITRIRDTTISTKEFKLYAEPGERRMSVVESAYISRDAFKMWEDKNVQINQILTERITALSVRINELERRLASATTIAPTALK